ncbi:MAG: hypothetical protein A3D37_00895 [Candidatus Zambryskibacteria bacterium RIFCSPHIGHO2_02_FULL_38_22]|uniref:Uncharacterized protein n=1 Tax=Candidatus Zambryskibacteria bacterium RIFCSPLOWO2_12_FULL_39_16 TaxID=1802775 RepID=A0A1G2UTS7_9BACT|nr:MAG: hypothetical protein A3D37_00895 [Candidatus Zambryskibacteria bacterium RIFCSPHIGHO2_02_FULL_38_22]OHB12766.1 MAG: hypothetical protein A3G46_02910 [Candidatus Zambryskibacteria bacterium RIFCSPLOWO2_12_FULL_39_16]
MLSILKLFIPSYLVKNLSEFVFIDTFHYSIRYPLSGKLAFYYKVNIERLDFLSTYYAQFIT